MQFGIIILIETRSLILRRDSESKTGLAYDYLIIH